MDAPHKDRILRFGPLGWWRTVAGTADVLALADVVFFPDGSGTITQRSVLSGVETTGFQWKLTDPGILGLRDPDDDEPGGPEYWWRVPIAFRVEQSDLGEVEVMHQAGSEGFWWLISPLRWVDEAPGRNDP